MTPSAGVREVCARTLHRFLESRCSGWTPYCGDSEQGHASLSVEPVSHAHRHAQTELRDARVLDPACGDGRLLGGMLAALYRLLTPAGERDHDPGERMRTIVERNLFGADVRIDAVENTRRRLTESCTSSGRPSRPNVVHVDALRGPSPFPDASPPGVGFDMIVANPPYVRHERITDPLDRVRPRRYKEMLRASAFAWLPAYFSGAEQQAQLDPRSDLALYFVLLSLSLLRPRGVAGILLPSALFQARYGRLLPKLLCHLGFTWEVVDESCSRRFPDIGVNTSLLLCTAPRTAPCTASSTAPPLKSTRETRPFAGMRATTARRPARDLARVLLTCIENALIPLAKIGPVLYGVRTGNNRFSYPDGDCISRWHIESRFCLPVLRSPRHVDRIAYDAVTVPSHLFHCDMSPDELRSGGWTGALGYVEWGATQRTDAGMPWPQIRSARGRRMWYTVPLPPPADIVCPRFFFERFVFAAPRPGLRVDQTFYGLVVPRDLDRDLVAALLNCSLSYLLVECHGRTGLGEGVRQYALCDMRDLPVLRPGLVQGESLSHVLELYRSLAARRTLPISEEVRQPDRQALDAAIGDLLGMSRGTMDEVRGVLCALVAERQTLARPLARGTSVIRQHGRPLTPRLLE